MGQQPSRHVGSASRSLSGSQANKVVFNGSPSEYSGHQSAKPGLFSAGDPASVFTGTAGVVAGTVVRRWNGEGGGRRRGPCVLFSGAVSPGQVAGPVTAETDLSDALSCEPSGTESVLSNTMEQHVDIPVPRRRGRNADLQGFLPEQSSTAMLSSAEPLSEQIVEQIVDFPVVWWRPPSFSPRTEFICINFISSWCSWFCK